MKVINTFLLVTILLSLSFGQLLRFHFLPFLPSFYLHDLLLFLFLIINFRSLLSLPKTKLIRAFSFFLLSLLVFNPNYLLTLRLATYFLSFFLFFRVEFDRQLLQLAFYFSLGLTLVIGLTQFIFMPDLRFLANLGWDDHLNRLTFPYLDPNFTAFIFVLFFFYLYPSLWSWFIFPLLGLTYSRSGFLVWIVGFSLSFQRKIWRYFISIFILGLLILFLPHRFGEGNNLFRFYSVKARLRQDFQIFQTQLHSSFKGKLISHYQTPNSFNRSETANNSFLYLWQVGGLVSLLSFLYFLYFLIKNSAHSQLWYLTLIASFFNNILFYPFVLLWLFFLELIDAKSVST